jgi:hypothetical protein
MLCQIQAQPFWRLATSSFSLLESSLLGLLLLESSSYAMGNPGHMSGSPKRTLRQHPPSTSSLMSDRSQNVSVQTSSGDSSAASVLWGRWTSQLSPVNKHRETQQTGCGFKPLHFGVLCYAAMNNLNLGFYKRTESLPNLVSKT